VALVVALFFAAYFVTYEPYRALYPDLVADDVAGRAQSTQALWRGSGTGLALLGGGLLFSLWRPLPFIAAATILLAAVGTFTVVRLRHRRVSQSERREPRSAPAGVGAVGREALGSLRRALREHPALRAFVAANALWELSLGALKTFVVLYLTAGLGYSVGTSSLIVGAVAVVILAAAAVSGRLGDRFGRGRVMHVALWAYAAGLLVPFVITTPGLIVPFVPLIAFGGGVIMTLPYALLMPMMPEREHGALTGIYSMSRGVGTVLGPLFAGVAIDALKRPLSGTEGYQAMWLVCSLGIVLSIPLLRSLRSHARDRERLQRA
jgi:Na+/melibiose symporter-like transporter